jgi:aminopeptidase N
MLPLLLPEHHYYKAVRRIYSTNRIPKPGTEDLKAAFEAESGKQLTRFFDRWIYGSSLPQLKFSYTTEPNAVIAKFEQVGEIFDVPVTVTIQYANNTSQEITVPVTDQFVELRVPTKSLIRSVEANRDLAAPVVFER